MSKTYRLSPEALQPLVEGRGRGIATSRITVDGAIVGHMYREDAAFPDDSGWRFTAGDEGDAYGNNPDNWDVVDLNLIANLDREIVPLLDNAVGAAFVRWPAGAPLRSVREAQGTAGSSAPGAEAPGDEGSADTRGSAGPSIDPFMGEEDDGAEAAPQESQRQALNRDWWIDLPGPFTGFMSSGALQLVSVNKPPRRVWVDIRNAPEPRPGVAALMVKDIRVAAKDLPGGAVEYGDTQGEPDEYRIAFWFEEHKEGQRGYWTLYAYTIRDNSFVQAAFLSTRPEPEWALAAWQSIRYEPGTGKDWEPAVPDDE
jgi:hypothetical protein